MFNGAFTPSKITKHFGSNMFDQTCLVGVDTIMLQTCLINKFGQTCLDKQYQCRCEQGQLCLVKHIQSCLTKQVWLKKFKMRCEQCNLFDQTCLDKQAHLYIYIENSKLKKNLGFLRFFMQKYEFEIQL